jgi:predicted DNA-binding transcriptional regulator AlpA
MQPSEPIRRELPQLQLIDAKDLASLLGRSVSSIERDEKQGRIPLPIKIGKHKKWRTGEIEAWSNAGCPLRAEWKFTGSAVCRAGNSQTPDA